MVKSIVDVIYNYFTSLTHSHTFTCAHTHTHPYACVCAHTLTHTHTHDHLKEVHHRGGHVHPLTLLVTDLTALTLHQRGRSRETRPESTKYLLGHASSHTPCPALSLVLVAEEEDEESTVGKLCGDALQEVAGNSHCRAGRLVLTAREMEGESDGERDREMEGEMERERWREMEGEMERWREKEGEKNKILNMTQFFDLKSLCIEYKRWRERKNTIWNMNQFLLLQKVCVVCIL